MLFLGKSNLFLKFQDDTNIVVARDFTPLSSRFTCTDFGLVHYERYLSNASLITYAKGN
jgi:hypothetical protein